MKNYLVLIKKSDFTDLFKFGYLFIDIKAVVEFDGNVDTLVEDKTIQKKVFERVNQFEYSFTVLLIHFSRENIGDGKIDIEDVKNIFPLDDNAKREIEISYDPRICIQNPIWPEVTVMLQERFLYEDAKKGAHNIWKILKIGKPLSDYEFILPNESLLEVVHEVQNDKRPKGNLPFWIYLFRYERHGFFPKNAAGFLMDLVNVFVNTLNHEECPSEVIETTNIYNRILEFQDLDMIKILENLSKTNEGINFFDKLNQVATFEGNSVRIALLFLVLRNTYSNGFNLKEDRILNYCKKYFPQELYYSLYLLGVYLGNSHTFECLYDSLPLQIFKSVDENEGIKSVDFHSSKESFMDEVLEFFDTKIRKTRYTETLRQGLVRTLEMLDSPGSSQDQFLGYKLITMLDNMEGWDKKPKPKAWQALQKQFCPNYEQIRSQKSVNSNVQVSARERNSNIGLHCEGRLFSDDDFYKDDSKNQSYSVNNSIYFASRANKAYNLSLILDEEVLNDVYAYLNVMGSKTENIKDAIINTFKYVRDKHKSNNSRTRSNPISTNREAVIYFQRLCFSDKNPNKLPSTSHNRQIVDSLGKYLLNKYSVY